MKFILRDVGVIWNSLAVLEQSISLNGKYDAWNIVHYQFSIILAIICFNTVSFASLHYGTKEIGDSFRHKCRYAKIIPKLSDQMISIEHGVGVIHLLSHIIRVEESRNTQFIIGEKKLKAYFVFTNYCTRQVDEIEFQCHLARYVIFNKGLMWCKLPVNLNEGLKDCMIF